MIGFRADANAQIGTGHLMRCISVAKKLKAYTEDIIFYTADAANESVILENGFLCKTLYSDYRELEQELPALTRSIEEDKVSVLLVDSYFVTEKYLAALKEKCRIAYIDDLHNMIYPCDLLINYSIFADKIPYEEEYEKTGTKLLLGCEFIPLRDEFADCPNREMKEQVKNVLVLSGGTDNYHFVLNFMEQIAAGSAYEDINFKVICGKYNADAPKLKKLAAEKKNITIYESISQMREFMMDADIAVSAGGTTLYELAACQTPTIGYALADNQLENLRTFAEKGLLLSVGDIRKSFPCEELKEALETMQDADVRRNFGQSMQKLVDGKGSRKFAEALANM